jgi:hypothetical protein
MTGISAAATVGFRMPRWIGVRIFFAMRVMAHDGATTTARLPNAACTNTMPRVEMTMEYEICQMILIVRDARPYGSRTRASR